MSTPPRRRRSEQRTPPGGSGWLPTLAMGLGVVVAGLGIGALAAVLLQRSPPRETLAYATAAPSLTSSPTPPGPAPRAPVAVATIVARHTPRPVPAQPPTPSPAPTLAASTPLAPSPSPSPSAALSPADSEPSPSPSPSPSDAGAAVATASRVALVTAEPRATPAVSATPTTPATESDSPAPSSGAPTSAYDEHASAVVRRYIDALIRGDQKAAYGALGATPGAPNVALTEQSFLDAGSRIVSLSVTRIDASNATVGCEIASAKGHYYATYHVTAASGGPYISEHDYIKVSS